MTIPKQVISTTMKPKQIAGEVSLCNTWDIRKLIHLYVGVQKLKKLLNIQI